MIKGKQYTRTGGLVLILMLIGFMFGPLLLPYSPDQIDRTSKRLSPPSIPHIFGTDQLGRDVLARVLEGGRISVSISLGTVICCLVLGSVYGAVSGYMGGWIDAIMMRIVDILLSFPILYLSVTVMAIIGIGIMPLIVVVILTSWMDIARLVRAEILSLKTRPFILKARSVGFTISRVVLVHLIPNVFPTLLAVTLLRVADIIMLESALSYLGLGVQPPTASLGSVISDGRMYLVNAWWITVFPGIAIVLTTASLYIIGEGLRKRFRGVTF